MCDSPDRSRVQYSDFQRHVVMSESAVESAIVSTSGGYVTAWLSNFAKPSISRVGALHARASAEPGRTRVAAGRRRGGAHAEPLSSAAAETVTHMPGSARQAQLRALARVAQLSSSIVDGAANDLAVAADLAVAVDLVVKRLTVLAEPPKASSCASTSDSDAASSPRSCLSASCERARREREEHFRW